MQYTRHHHHVAVSWMSTVHHTTEYSRLLFFYFFQQCFAQTSLRAPDGNSFSRPSTLPSFAVWGGGSLQLRVESEVTALLDQVRQVDFALLHLLEKTNKHVNNVGELESKPTQTIQGLMS